MQILIRFSTRVERRIQHIFLVITAQNLTSILRSRIFQIYKMPFLERSMGSLFILLLLPRHESLRICEWRMCNSIRIPRCFRISIFLEILGWFYNRLLALCIIHINGHLLWISFIWWYLIVMMSVRLWASIIFNSFLIHCSLDVNQYLLIFRSDIEIFYLRKITKTLCHGWLWWIFSFNYLLRRVLLLCFLICAKFSVKLSNFFLFYC